jgi:tRNA threonylcarbamoyladenosine biosynthesis protein TsaB
VIRRALCIETTTRTGQVALLSHDGIKPSLTTRTFASGLRHAAALAQEVKHLLDQTATTPADLDAVFVSVGPGSFTGTRVGVTFAKTLAFATGCRIVAVPTADIIRANVGPDAVVVLDARRGKVWTSPPPPPPPTPPPPIAPPPGDAQLLTPPDLLARLPRPVTLVGEGIAFHRDSLDVDGVTLLDEAAAVPRVANLAVLGEKLAERGQWADVESLVPVYVRRPEAEEKRLEVAVHAK